MSSHLGPLVHNSDVLSKVAILLAADGARAPVLVVDIVNVPLQVGLEVAAVATLSAFEIFNLYHKRNNQIITSVTYSLLPHLHVLLVDVMSQVCELPVAVGAGLGLA